MAPSSSTLLNRLLALGARADELASERASRQTLVLGGALMSVGGLLWGTLCLAYQLPWPSLVPYGYVVATLVNFAVLSRTKRFPPARLVQVVLSLLLPFAFQWSLGGFAPSGVVMVWSMIALVGSLTLSSARQALVWLALYMALTLASGAVEVSIAGRAPLQLSFLLINLLCVSTIVFVLSLVLTQRQRASIVDLERERRHGQELNAQLQQLLVARGEDIERLQRAEAELRESAAGLEVQVKERTLALHEALLHAEAGTRAKSEFLAMMSHEIRTPLNGILGTADLLATSSLDPGQLELVRLVHRSGKLLLTIINDVLDFSKIEAGRLELSPRRVELLRELADQVGLYRPLAAEQGVSIELEVDPGVPAVVSLDCTRLAQVVGNLVGNAVKFTPSGTIKVSVRAEPAGSRHRLLVEVSDTGIGISIESVPRLFQPFSQAEQGHARRFGGTGLGLAICARLVALMGGRITVESAVGKGTTFRFDVLCEVLAGEAPHAILTPLPIAPAFPPGTSLRVLLAEDNVVNQTVARRLLQSLGCVVDVVSNGEEAVARVTAGGYDLVLMDVQMPVMDGIAATRAIRERLPDLRPRIVAVTANAFPSDRDACLKAGMDDFEPKPLRLDGLRRQLVLTASKGGRA